MKYTLESAFSRGDKVESNAGAFSGAGEVTGVEFSLRGWFGFAYQVAVPGYGDFKLIREYELRAAREGQPDKCRQCGRAFNECPVGI